MQTETLVDQNLQQYLKNNFLNPENKKVKINTDTSFWNKLNNEFSDIQIFEKLKSCYPQLCFPIELNIKNTKAYIDATLKGINNQSNQSLGLEKTNKLKFYIHESMGIKAPVLIVSNKKDFVKIIQALSHKNDPIPVPDSMGAAVIKGLNNWQRINNLKQQFFSDDPLGNWGREFTENIIKNKSLYQDELIILSTKPYSNISGENLTLSQDKWTNYSLIVRLEHEFTHLYTLKEYGKMSINLHDELIADYIGICKAFGSFNKNWMLYFLGLENFPEYRKGARLENYMNFELSSQCFKDLTNIIKKAIDNIEKFDREIGKIKSMQDQKARIHAICETDIPTIASSTGFQSLINVYNNYI